MLSSVSDIQVFFSCCGQILEIMSLVKKYVHIYILLSLCIKILSFTCHWLCSCYVFFFFVCLYVCFFFFLLQNLFQRCVLSTLKKMVELEVYWWPKNHSVFVTLYITWWFGKGWQLLKISIILPVRCQQVFCFSSEKNIGNTCFFLPYVYVEIILV